MKFTEFGFNDKLLECIESIGFSEATPIQEQTIPVILSGKDLIGSAQTGTGKTAAFLLPIIQKITNLGNVNTVKALIVVPTRELAVQIDQQMEGLSYFTNVSSIPIYGGTDGVSFEREKQSLLEGCDVVICTPGRMIAHLNQGYVNFTELKFLVLDEADRMLDMGFFDDIMKIISFLPKKRQNILFAATMPPKIADLARKTFTNPIEISISISKPAEKILQLAYVVYDNQKIPMIADMLDSQKLKSILIFCSTKSATKQVRRSLKSEGLNAEEIHSDIDQSAREKVMLDFRNKKIPILVATDVLSRGIDVEDIDLVINYDVPNDGEDYIHRIGRTARAQADGVAITFISPDDQRKFSEIENLLKQKVHKGVVASKYGPAPEYNPTESNYRHSKNRVFRKPRNNK